MNTPRFYFLILTTLVSLNTVIAQEQEHSLWSDTLKEERTYWVQLPDSYDSSKEYGLMVVTDGDFHFEYAAQVTRFLMRYHQLPELIVVGIDIVNRERDYTPDKIKTTRPNQMGGANHFLHFLEKELLPVLEKAYTLNDIRLLAGHSLGGLLATHAYMKDQTEFTHFIAIDPSYGVWDEALMNKKVAAVSAPVFDRKIYMATANWGDDRNNRNKGRHELLFQKMTAIGQKAENAQLKYFEDETHRTVPLQVWYHGLRFLFGK